MRRSFCPLATDGHLGYKRISDAITGLAKCADRTPMVVLCANGDGNVLTPFSAYTTYQFISDKSHCKLPVPADYLYLT
jgi:hypothetical protein